ncbi:hypothetical protein [Paraclostridium sordellii]|uniref:hypothetical protein n=1 Tax=Paraclostridium sordellii TaxID=1505 RepID=UPI0005DDBE37|nr:hypothetical protein [Paeniclostridium sordellii]CEQ26783.1 Uncharacterised protein [[Clostridium] sordellii] [Paeniclostridium sordellii]
MENLLNLLNCMKDKFILKDEDDLDFLSKFKELAKKEELVSDVETNNFKVTYEPINIYYTVGKFYIDILDEKDYIIKKYELTLKYTCEQPSDLTKDDGRDYYIPNIPTIEIDVINRVEYVKYKENLCFKCLQEKEDINTYGLKGRGYGSKYQNAYTKLQLCDECVGSIKKHEELKKWFYEKPKMEDICTEDYKYEDEIAEYIKTIPIQGQEIFYNQLSNSWIEDSQEWIDKELGLITEDEIEINESITEVACVCEDDIVYEEIDPEDEDFDI